MEKTTTQQIEDERIKFVRENILIIEEEDLLAKPTGSCPNSKSAINIEQVVTYKPLPIEEAKLDQNQNNFNLGKTSVAKDLVLLVFITSKILFIIYTCKFVLTC